MRRHCVVRTVTALTSGADVATGRIGVEAVRATTTKGRHRRTATRPTAAQHPPPSPRLGLATAFGGTGAFVDDTRLVVGGSTSGAEGFEKGLGPWAIPGPPTGGSPGTGSLARSTRRLPPVVTTADTALLGVGVERVASRSDWAALLERAFRSAGSTR